MNAFAHLVAAINAPADRALLERAVTPTVRVDRHDPGDETIAERFDGIDAVARWLARTPAHCKFALADEPRVLADRTYEVTYTIGFDDFENTGTWIAEIVDDRIATLAHHPRAL